MADNITLSCVEDLRQFFSRSQHYLEPEFRKIETIEGSWDGKIRNGGNFPLGTGGRARVSTMGPERMSHEDMVWTPLVGLQEDCVTSCNVPSREVTVGNADHRWYGVFTHAQHTSPFCLESMWLDAFNLPAQIRNRYENLKRRSVDVLDEFYRQHQVAYSDNKWVGIADGTNSGQIRKSLWRFETDANGTPNVNKIIVDESVLDADGTPANIGLLSVDTLNWIRNYGIYDGAFPKKGMVPIITDYETADNLPKYDTNVRMDNRYRAPGSLDPAYGAVSSYAGYNFETDDFSFRYYWDTEDPNYPNGVLTRISHWKNRQVSEGVISTANDDYLNADFILTIPFNPNVWEWQNYETPNPPNMPYERPDSPYNGIWRFVNEVNEVTPCNSQRNLAYFQMILKKAAKPDRPHLGHVVLHRRFNSRGVFKSCKPLMVPVGGGSYYDEQVCRPLEHYPPAYATRTVCGSWSGNGPCGS